MISKAVRILAAKFEAAGEVLNIGASIIEEELKEDNRAQRRILKATAVRPSQAKEGERVKIVGTARRHERAVHAPLTGSNCLYFKTVVNRQNGEEHQRCLRRDVGADFWLDTADGPVHIITLHSKALLRETHSSYCGMLKASTEAQRTLLASEGLKVKSFSMRKTLDFHEGMIQEGDQVTAHGLAFWGTFHGTPTLVLKSTPKTTLWLTNLPS